MIQPKVSGVSVMGARHQTNDDFFFMNPEQGVFVICDGVSEGGQGKYASETAAKSIQEKLIQGNAYLKKNGAQLLGPKRLQAMQDILLKTFTETQENLQKLSETNVNYKFAATTCIAVWLDGRFAILAHIGDSRAYLCRAGKVYQLTKDHSGLDELMKMGLSYEAAMKNPMAHSLTRAFGQARFTQPDLLKIEFQPNDVLFLCTDGVYNALQGPSQQQFFQGIAQGKDLKPLADKCAQASGDDSTMLQISFPNEIYHESLIQASDRIKLIQQTPLSKYFDYIQKSHIAAICEIEEYKKGSIVVQEDTEGDSMYIVARGTLEILLKGSHLTYKQPGEFIGEVGLVQQHSKRTATVVAKEDTVLLSLRKGDLFQAFQKDPEMEKHFYRAMLEMIMERMLEQGQQIAQLRKA